MNREHFIFLNEFLILEKENTNQVLIICARIEIRNLELQFQSLNLKVLIWKTIHITTH